MQRWLSTSPAAVSKRKSRAALQSRVEAGDSRAISVQKRAKEASLASSQRWYAGAMLDRLRALVVTEQAQAQAVQVDAITEYLKVVRVDNENESSVSASHSVCAWIRTHPCIAWRTTPNERNGFLLSISLGQTTSSSVAIVDVVVARSSPLSNDITIHARIYFARYTKLRGGIVADVEAQRFFHPLLGLANLASDELLETWELIVLEPRAPIFPPTHSLHTKSGRSHRWALGYEYMLPDFRAVRDVSDSIATSLLNSHVAGLIFVEALTCMLVATYSIEPGMSHASANSLVSSMRDMNKSYRHHESVHVSTFYTLAPPETQHARIKLPNKYTMFPNSTLHVARCAMVEHADKQGTVHVPSLHYANVRAARGPTDLPAWRRISGTTLSDIRQREHASMANSAMAVAVSEADRLMTTHFPSVARAHTHTATEIPRMQPISTCGLSEAFGSVDLIAAPHDGLRDKQYGMNTCVCTKTAPQPHVQAQAMRAMLLLPWRIRLPLVHGAWWLWRPHMYPHFLVAPSEAEGHIHDAIVGVQLSARTADTMLDACSHTPRLIREECELRDTRMSAAFPALEADEAHTARILEAVGVVEPF